MDLSELERDLGRLDINLEVVAVGPNFYKLVNEASSYVVGCSRF